jgi:DeoR family glycerol-3-phosphate regulon repressor
MVEVGKISQIDHLFTNAAPPEPFAALLADAEVQLHITD